jgi:type IV pilus biogenesis protein CpaD/CtpE
MRCITRCLILLVLLGLVLLGIAACAPDRPVISPPSVPPDDWTYGPTQTHEVPAAPNVTVKDPATGVVARFPAGGASSA